MTSTKCSPLSQPSALRAICSALILASSVVLTCPVVLADARENCIALETLYLKYVIGKDGSNQGFIDKVTGVDHCLASPKSHFATLNKQGKQYTGTVVAYDGSRMELQFGESGSRALLGIKNGTDYFTFEVLELENSGGITELSLLNLTLDIKGEPNEPFAACAVDLNIQTFNSKIPGFNRILQVYCNARDGFQGASVAVIGCPGARLQGILKQVIRDHKDLPQTDLGGPWASEAEITHGSYLIATSKVSEENVDDWVKAAKTVGAKQIDLHCGETLRFGDLKPNAALYPDGFDSVKNVIRKLHQSGLAVGLHTYAFYFAKDSQWVRPVPDPRIGKDRVFTLSKELDDKETTVWVDESTKGMSAVTGFLIANSATLQIDNELIVFSGVESNAPYAFTRCIRGACGTKAAAHTKNAKVSQLREIFGLFNPNGDSTLFDEVARRTAEVYNDCGFDMIYLDAIDGAGALAGQHTPNYYQAKFIFELCRHLKKPALMEMSAFDSHFWFARSRMGAWDVPSKCYKLFINNHYAENLSCPKSFLPGNIGWWAIWDWTPKDRLRMFQDDVEYLLCKSLATGDSLSWIEAFTPELIAKSASQKRFGALIRQYEELRLTNYFPEATRKQLGEVNQDFTLERAENGQWQFRPVAFNKHFIEGIDGRCNVWKSPNKYSEQPVKLRIEASLSLASYDDAKGEVVEDFKELGRFADPQSSPGVSFSLETASSPARSNSVSGCYQANCTNRDARSRWFMTTRNFKSAVDFSKRGFGVWVYGDGNGEVLNLMWKAPANVCMGIDEHYVVVDFKGWKYFEFIEPESDRVGAYDWPYRRPTGAPYVETAWVAYDRIDSLTLGCINIPADKGVRCYLSPIKALPHVTTKLIKPSITIGGKKLLFPIDLESGYYIDFRSLTDCKVYGPKGDLVGELKPEGEVPVLTHGDNQVEFNCGIDAPVTVRANVTVISQDNRTFGK